MYSCRHALRPGATPLTKDRNLSGAEVSRLSANRRRRIMQYRESSNERSQQDMSFVDSVTLPNGIRYEQPCGLFINNDFVAGSAAPIDSYNPYTNEKICTVQAASVKDVDTAVAAAETALPRWRKTRGTERARLLFRLADLIDRDLEVLAAIEAADNGKAFGIALAADIPGASACLRYFAGWCDKQYGQVVDMGPGDLSYVKHEPIGVVAQIIPWNFPLLIWAWKIAPAIACGNVCVIKSAEQTPLSALYTAKLVAEAGFPPGVINVLSGLGREAGAALASQMRVRKLAFTGSTGVGRTILKAAAESNLKRVTLELGGKSPHIVFADAKFEQAVEAVAMGIFFNHGQNCCAGARAFVEAPIYDRFIAALKERISKIKLGDPFSDDTFQGPQVSAAQRDRIMALVDAGKRDSRLVIGGSAKEGLFIEPTVFADVPATSALNDEIFGPVLCIYKFERTEDMLALANATEFGLASGLHTTSLDTALHVADQLEAGVVWVNTYGSLPAQLPMGGYKQSGIGRDLGAQALAEYTQTKTVQISFST